MIEFLIIPYMAMMSAYAGGSLPFSEKLDEYKLTWLPELLFAVPIGAAPSMLVYNFFGWWSILAFLIFTFISYIFMQSGTWMFLRWETHNDPNTERDSTLKPFIDFIANIFGFKLGQEGYAWIAAGVKGFLITLPVGGTGVIFWPLGYEAGSHTESHTYSELFSGAGAGISILIFYYLTLS